MGTFLRRVLIAALAVATVGPAPALSAQPTTSIASRVLHVAPWGSDTAPGSASSPWQTLDHSLKALAPGDTLVVHGGTYREQVKVFEGRMTPGTPDAPVTVMAAPGERPVIEGLLWLYGADHWIVDGINVTWSPANQPKHHMVAFHGGTAWRLTNAEIWGARSYAGLLVGSGAQQFRVDHNQIHHTYQANDRNQDHLIYVDNGHYGSGVIERNVLAHSPNGRGIKLGPGSLSLPGTSNIVIRHNTLYDNQGPANIQLSGSSSKNRIEGNVMVRPRSGYTNVSRWNLSGTDNVVADNIGWESTDIADWGGGIVDGHGNQHFDPKLTSLAGGRYAATDPTAAGRGHLAPGDRDARPSVPARPTALACPTDVMPEDGFGDVREGTPHETMIDCVVWRALAKGRTEAHYGPGVAVTRGQMASFIARLAEAVDHPLPEVPRDAFADDNGSVHEHRINQLAQAGVVGGVRPREYGPGAAVSREQMATFLVRAVEAVTSMALAGGDGDPFVDDAGSPHETNIGKAANAGLATGIAPAFYDPRRAVRRDQMASFLARTLDLLIEQTTPSAAAKMHTSRGPSGQPDEQVSDS